MRIFTITIYIFAAIALITGASDFIQGLASQSSFGATLPVKGVAIADNVFRFFSGLWFGVGVLFILFIRDLDRYKPALIALLCIVVLGGIGRIISIFQYGMPEHPSGLSLVLVGLLAEVVISPIMIGWLLLRNAKA